MAETFVCETCWSEDVAIDASAYWDKEKQDWVVGSIQDSEWCNFCEGEARLETFPLLDDGNVKWPSLEEVVNGEENLRLIARARLARDEFTPEQYTAELPVLYGEVMKHCTLPERIDFVAEHPTCDFVEVEDMAIKEGMTWMIKYVSTVARGNHDRVVDAMIRTMIADNDPGSLDKIIGRYLARQKGETLGYYNAATLLNDAQMDKLFSVYKLLGGVKT